MQFRPMRVNLHGQPLEFRMYYWRELSSEQRELVLQERKGRHLPWHSPPHIDFTGPVTCIFTAACYEHKPIIGKTSQRLEHLERGLIDVCRATAAEMFGWCILPNHYHLLARCPDIKTFRRELGKVHGRTSREWNINDDCVGRKVWFNFFDRNMKSERHFWASLNYIHHNAVHHGYVDRWQDWPHSSASKFLDAVGHQKAEEIWKEFPVLDYGKDWDIY